jgi:glutathione S-transferase
MASDLNVYWVSGSPYSWRVLLALEVKGLEYESHLLRTEAGDLDGPEFRRLNPRGCVPTITDGELVLMESLAILAYLDRAYPDTPLFGHSASAAGAIWGQILEFSDYLEPYSKGIVKTLYAGAQETRRAEIADHLVRVHSELARIEGVIGTSLWFVGGQISAADIAVYPFLKSLFRSAAKPEAKALHLDLLPIATRYPAIERWMGRIEAMPGYERTYPPGWTV